MESSWKITLSQLQEYVKANPGISIAAGITIIPSEVRPGFYSLFDRVETDFVQENFPRYLEKGYALSAAWASVSQDVASRMSLESIGISPSLRWFLNNPVDGLARYFSDDLFAVLKGEIDGALFEARNRQRVPPMFADFFKEGYRRWVATAVLSCLDADKAFRVPAADAIADPLMGEGHENPGQRINDLPQAEPVRAISYEQHPIVSFVAPKVLVWSVKLGRYAALHSEFVEPYWTAREVSDNVEWLNYTALKRDNGLAKIRPDQKILPDLTRILPDIALYTSPNLEDLIMLADHSRIARSDLSIEVMEEADWFEKGKLASVKRHHTVMKPKHGTFIICREPPPQAAFDELLPKPVENTQPPDAPPAQAEETQAVAAVQQSAPVAPPEAPLDIHIVVAGYDASKMDAVINALNCAQPV